MANSREIAEGVLKELTDLQITSDGDPESAHRYADELLCELLDALGFGDIVGAWEKVTKWYA